MRHFLTGLMLVAALWPAPASANDECRNDVDTAFAKQREQKAYRFAAEMPAPEGTTRMTIEYQRPDRMYQKVEAPGHPKPVETIAVGRWAWGTMGGGWEELQPQFAQSIIAHVRETLINPPKLTADFTCLGKVTLDGAELVGYQAAQPASASADPKAPQLARTVYVDPKSGLPSRNVVARVDGKEAPVFDGRYTYPTDIAIEPPIGGYDTQPAAAGK